MQRIVNTPYFPYDLFFGVIKYISFLPKIKRTEQQRQLTYMLNTSSISKSNLGAYQNKFLKQKKFNKIFLSWNPWAFLFGPCWFFYRKMFVVGTLITLFYAALSYGLYLSPLTPAYFPKLSYKFIFLIGNGLFASLANWIYVLHITKCRKSKNTKIQYGFKFASIGIIIMIAITFLLVFAEEQSKEFKVRQIDNIIDEDGPLSLRLYQKGLLNNYQGDNGETLVFYAARRNLVNQLSYLADRGADLEKPVSEGHTPLYIATAKGHIEAMRILLRHGAQVDGISRFVDDQSSTIHQQTALFAAALTGNVKAIKLLKGYGADVNFTSSVHKPFITPIYSAISKNHVEAVKTLIELGADVNYIAHGKNNMIATPLICAVQFGDLEIVKLLVEHGADVHYAMENKVSVPLHIAKQENRTDIAEYLVTKGAT